MLSPGPSRFGFAHLVAALFVIYPAVTVPLTAAERPQQHGPITVHSTGDEIVVGDRGGEVIVVDAETRQVRDRQRVGPSLTDLQPLSDGRWLASTSQGLVLLNREPRRPPSGDGSYARQSVVRNGQKGAKQRGWLTGKNVDLTHVVSLAVHPQGRIAAAAGLWSRRVTLLTIDQDQLQVAAHVDLPFAPRCQCWLKVGGGGKGGEGEQELLVLDSFGGGYAILNSAGETRHAGTLPVHNVRGLLPDDATGQLYVSHQTMNPVATTERESVFWGEVIRSLYSRVAYADLLQEGEPAMQTVYPLSTPGDAAADPGQMVSLPEGGVAIALSGVGQVGLKLSRDGVLLRRNVGHRPQAVAFNSIRREVYVASTLSDRLSVIQLDTPEKVRNIPLRENRENAKLSSVQRGERLFYDGQLSLDGWFSCHSCHTDGHSNGRTNDNLGDGDFGHPKRIPSLLGVGETGPWGWDASKHQLSSQILGSVKTTMQGEEIDEEAASDLAEYLLTLQPAPGISKARKQTDTRKQPDTAQVELGARTFRSANCINCHAPPNYTTGDTYDVGLQADGDTAEFNPPSLLGVSQRDRLFHDGRAKSLEDVLKRFQHGQDEPLNEEQRKALLAFLRSL